MPLNEQSQFFPMHFYHHRLVGFQTKPPKNGWFLGVADTNDVIQKIEKTLNNTHTTTQKLTNNSVRNTKKHPKNGSNCLWFVYSSYPLLNLSFLI